MSMAFSWTCQPNIKEEQAQRTMARMNTSLAFLAIVSRG